MNFMNDSSASDQRNLDVVGHLEELRRRIIVCLAFILGLSILMFYQCDLLMRIVQMPSAGLIRELIFITPAEVFSSCIKISLLGGVIAGMPVVLYQTLMFFLPAVSEVEHKNVVFWIFLLVSFFILGVLFSYFIAVPAALKFLMGFGGDIAVARITVSKYISFFISFILIGGIMFELPIALSMLTDIGITGSTALKAKRQYAVIAVLVFSAVITPTTDIVNMMIFALPMLLLYEIGIIFSLLIERQKKLKESV